jgi:hypothetical protein
MPKALVEFESKDGPVTVEVDAHLAGPRPAAAAPDVASKAAKSFTDALAGIKPIAAGIMSQLADLSPAETTVEFGVKFTAKAGVILTSAEGEAHCKVTLSFKKGL